jgi:hypothetical protein
MRLNERIDRSDISYQDYKKLQIQMAFRHAVGSERNKRLVR